jgi:hypothetical protein
MYTRGTGAQPLRYPKGSQEADIPSICKNVRILSSKLSQIHPRLLSVEYMRDLY